jgi:hypothetical protein
MGDIFDTSHTHPTADITEGWAGKIIKGLRVLSFLYIYFLYRGSRNNSVSTVTRSRVGYPKNRRLIRGRD